MSGGKPGRPREWDRPSILAAALRWHFIHGRPPTYADWREWRPGYPTAQTVRNYLGSWSAMFEALGWPHYRPGPTGRVAFPQRPVLRSEA